MQIPVDARYLAALEEAVIEKTAHLFWIAAGHSLNSWWEASAESRRTFEGKWRESIVNIKTRTLAAVGEG